MVDERLEQFLKDVGKSVALGMVPGLGQAIDIYDTLYSAFDIYQAKDQSQAVKDEAYFGMAMALVGWIPGPGDGIKKTLKTVNKNPQDYAPLLLDAVRYGLYEAGYKADPYTFLMESISEGKLRALLNACKNDLQGSSIFKKAPAWTQEAMLIGLELAAQSLPLLVGVVERKVHSWLHLAPKSSAKPRGGTTVKSKDAKQPPSQQPKAKADTSKGGKPNAQQVLNGTVNAIEIGTANINQLQESVGEHVADYFCHDTLKWGTKHGKAAQHDAGQKGAKLSDFGKLSQLKANVKARGIGIDAVWLGGAKPYAVTEYKTRNMGLSKVAIQKLLVAESAQDVDAKGPHQKSRADYNKRRKAAVKNGQTFNDAQPSLAKDVPKMSHKWISQRIGNVAGLSSAQIDALKNRAYYTRHVIQVVTSAGDGEVHGKELQTARSEKREVQAAKHTGHQENIHNFTDVFTEAPDDRNKASGTSQLPKKKR